jgi:hypothetical protein
MFMSIQDSWGSTKEEVDHEDDSVVAVAVAVVAV